MKITTSYLKKLIKEELDTMDPAGGMSAGVTMDDLVAHYASKYGEEGKADSQSDIYGIAKATIPETGIQKGDFLTVKLVNKRGTPMGRYRLYNREDIEKFKNETRPSTPGRYILSDHSGKWYNGRPHPNLDKHVRSISGEGYLLTWDQMMEVGAVLPWMIDKERETDGGFEQQYPTGGYLGRSGKIYKESKITTSSLKKVILEEFRKLKK